MPRGSGGCDDDRRKEAQRCWLVKSWAFWPVPSLPPNPIQLAVTMREPKMGRFSLAVSLASGSLLLTIILGAVFYWDDISPGNAAWNGDAPRPLDTLSAAASPTMPPQPVAPESEKEVVDLDGSTALDESSSRRPSNGFLQGEFMANGSNWRGASSIFPEGCVEDD